MTTTTVRKHPLHESVEKYKIRRVAVVDDAFDAVSRAALQEGEDEEFLAAVNEDDVLLREFHSLVSQRDITDILKKKDLTNKAVNLLWKSRTGLPHLQPGTLDYAVSSARTEGLGG